MRYSRWRSLSVCGRWQVARGRCALAAGWYCVESEVQAQELMDTPATEIESFGNLIEGESDDRAQAEHLKLALALDVPSGP